MENVAPHQNAGVENSRYYYIVLPEKHVDIMGLKPGLAQFCRNVGPHIMRVDLSPRLGGGHTVANQPPTTVLLSFTSIPPGTVYGLTAGVEQRHELNLNLFSPYCDLLD